MTSLPDRHNFLPATTCQDQASLLVLPRRANIAEAVACLVPGGLSYKTHPKLHEMARSIVPGSSRMDEALNSKC